MGAIKKGRGRNSRFPEFSRVSSPYGIRQRMERRIATMGRDDPAAGLHVIKPGSRNPRKVGR